MKKVKIYLRYGFEYSIKLTDKNENQGGKNNPHNWFFSGIIDI